MTQIAPVPTSTNDPVNAAILSVSEDRIQGFTPDPIGEIAQNSTIDADVVVERIRAMLHVGTIRRVRQTLMSVNLAPGALVAWSVPEEKLSSAFDWMFKNDPFSGHVVIRSTDAAIAGAKYRLWTTLKVPVGFSMEKHCRLLMEKTGATGFRCMPARKLFVLGVGHVRRRGMEPGSKADVAAEAHDTHVVQLSDLDWRVLNSLKREFKPDEITRDLWAARADEAGVSLETFLAIARSLNDRRVIGRFSTFLEHVKPNAAGERVTKFNALFHWAVPPGRELEAGGEVGRFHIMTHAYWREGGAEFGNVNVMGVAHGTDKELVLAHKRAIDEHLAGIGIAVSYTNVFWGGRSEIKPSEIAPAEYVRFCEGLRVNVDAMRD
ncbi:MAG: Lrp/AsnC family transcriptional regulator [Burkholderiales bacterium]|nr:Lrp/AsnC family transcriptional regulator [Phycisphaerae bacterium]